MEHEQHHQTRNERKEMKIDIPETTISEALDRWNVKALVKFVSKKEYAEQLLQGKPYLQAIEEFRATEQGDGRADPCEGLVSPIMGANMDRAVYCMTRISDLHFGRFLQSPDGQRVRNEFAQGGAAVLIKDPVEFLKRFQDSEPEGIGFGPIVYDGCLFETKTALAHWKDAASIVPYHKNQTYAYQHEFRIVTGHDCKMKIEMREIDGEEHPIGLGHEPYNSLDIGRIDDIAELIPFK